MKKLLITACLTLILATSLVLSACTGGTAPEPIKVSTSSPYSEEAFADIMAEPKDFYLAKDGVSEYAIAVSPNVSGIDTDTKFLQSTLREMTGDDDAFALVDALPELTPCIAIGFNAAPEGVADDGYALTYDEDGNIFIDAKSSDGLANGIYCFLENELGCMFVRDDYSYIPRLETIALAAEDKIDNPDFRWRRIYQYEVSHEAYESDTPTESIWSRRIKSNGTGYRYEDLGNDGNRYWGKWCHSVFSYVPPEQYFDEHPEYYAEIGGVRMHTADDGLPTQLCLTNEELYPIIHDNMAEMMEQYPDAIYWDFSINDSWHMCECADCTAAYEKYGSQMGAMLEIVNRLADDFPDKIISTLAYFYNNVVPQGMTCRDNVNIVIAPIQTSQLYSASDDGNEKSAEAKRMIESWSAICDNLVVWDYTASRCSSPTSNSTSKTTSPASSTKAAANRATNSPACAAMCSRGSFGTLTPTSSQSSANTSSSPARRQPRPLRPPRMALLRLSVPVQPRQVRRIDPRRAGRGQRRSPKDAIRKGDSRQRAVCAHDRRRLRRRRQRGCVRGIQAARQRAGH